MPTGQGRQGQHHDAPGAQIVAQAAQEVQTTLAAWHPESGLDIDGMLGALPEYMHAQQQVFTNMAQVLHMHASEHPVVAELEQAAGNFHSLADTFQHVYDVHTVEHERGMDRYNDPRPGEETWDVPGEGRGGPGHGAELVQEATSTITNRFGPWEPEDGKDFDSMLEGLPEFMRAQRFSFNHMAEVLGDSAEPAVVDAMKEAASEFDGMGDQFEEVYKRHRVEHEWEMKRFEEPKPAEDTWNVGG